MKFAFTNIFAVCALAACVLPVAEPSSAVRAAQAGNRLVADSSLDGRTGTATPNARNPILTQTVLLTRTIEVLEETGVQWAALDTETIKAGQVLFGVGPLWCTHWLVCLADQDNDGKLETGFMQYNRFNDVLIFTRVEGELGPIKTPVRYKPVPAPESYRHEVGVMLDQLTEVDGTRKAKFTVRVRRAGESWIVLGGPGTTINLDAEGRGVFDFMGARIELQAKDTRNFTYTIVRGMPEQSVKAVQVFR